MTSFAAERAMTPPVPERPTVSWIPEWLTAGRISEHPRTGSNSGASPSQNFFGT
jgi:hypothetical protein